MKFKTLFMSNEEKRGHNFDLPLFFNMSKQFLAPGDLSELTNWVCSSYCHINLGPPGWGSWLWGPQGLRSSKCSNIIVVIGTNLIFLVSRKNLFRKMVKNVKWWSKSNLPLSQTAQFRPFLKGLKIYYGVILHGVVYKTVLSDRVMKSYHAPIVCQHLL